MHLPRLVAVVLGAVAVGAVTLAQLNLPSPAYWTQRRDMLYVAVVLLVAVALTEVFGSLFTAVQMTVVRRFDQEMRAVLSYGISAVADQVKADWRDIGVSAFRLRGRWWFRRLVLVDSMQMGGRPSVGMRWRPGTSVVGAAFDRQELLALDWDAFFRKAETAGRVAWDGQSGVQRFGLNWGQLNRTKALSGVIACPVFGEGGRVVGVVCVEAPADLSEPAVGSTVKDLSIMVSDVGAPPLTWWSYVGGRAR